MKPLHQSGLAQQATIHKTSTVFSCVKIVRIEKLMNRVIHRALGLGLPESTLDSPLSQQLRATKNDDSSWIARGATQIATDVAERLWN